MLDFLETHLQEISMAILLVALLGPFAYFGVVRLSRSFRRRLTRRARAMGKKKEMDQFLADLLTWGLEDAAYKGRFTRQQIQQKYQEFADKMGLDDLRPKVLGQKKLGRIQQLMLKQRIRKRLGMRWGDGPKLFPIMTISKIFFIREKIRQQFKRAA